MKSKRILTFIITLAMLLGNMSPTFAAEGFANKSGNLPKAHSMRRAPVRYQEVIISIGELHGINGKEFDWDALPNGELKVKAFCKEGTDYRYSDEVTFTKTDRADKTVRISGVYDNAIDSFGITSDVNGNRNVDVLVTSGAGTSEADGKYKLTFDVAESASPLINIQWRDPYNQAIEGSEGGKLNITVGTGEDTSVAKPDLPSRDTTINLLAKAFDYTEYGDIENKSLNKRDTVDIDGTVLLNVSLDGKKDAECEIKIGDEKYTYKQ